MARINASVGSGDRGGSDVEEVEERKQSKENEREWATEEKGERHTRVQRVMDEKRSSQSEKLNDKLLIALYIGILVLGVIWICLEIIPSIIVLTKN